MPIFTLIRSFFGKPSVDVEMTEVIDTPPVAERIAINKAADIAADVSDSSVASVSEVMDSVQLKKLNNLPKRQKTC